MFHAQVGGLEFPASPGGPVTELGFVLGAEYPLVLFQIFLHRVKGNSRYRHASFSVAAIASLRRVRLPVTL